MNFTVANFNVENLILPGIRYYDRLLCTQEEYDAKANWIARTLNRIRPDIVGIQEVWSEEALHDIIGRCPHFAEGANVCAPGASREDNVVGHLAKRPRLGLVSKFPISNAEAIASFPKSVSLTIPLRIDGGHVVPVPVGILQFQRPVLKAQVLVQNTKITVFVAHLKSKGPMIAEGEDGDDPFQFALGQARATFGHCGSHRIWCRDTDRNRRLQHVVGPGCERLQSRCHCVRRGDRESQQRSSQCHRLRRRGCRTKQ